MTSDASDHLRVDIRVHEGALLKVVWNTAHARSLPYYIDRDAIVAVSADVRSQLTELVLDARNAQLTNAAHNLKSLAVAGARLHTCLFTALEGQGEADEVREWLDGRKDPYTVSFSVEDRVHIPWGLAYDGDPASLPSSGDASNIQCYEDFWCFKHRVSSMYSRLRPRSLDNTRGEAPEVLLILNQQVYSDVVPHLSAAEQHFLEQLGQPVWTSEAFFQRWSTVAASTDLLYFFCHADGESLGLGWNDRISVQRLRESLATKRATAQAPPCLVFLNGCSTAAGAQSGGFLEATGRQGFCGFVGTEAKVPAVFAKRFGVAFLEACVSGGESVEEIMDRLRRTHWPLGLLYGTYCYPLLRFAPTEGASAPVMKSANLCLEQLGPTDLAAGAHP